jgi:hypothetical protein
MHWLGEVQSINLSSPEIEPFRIVRTFKVEQYFSFDTILIITVIQILLWGALLYNNPTLLFPRCNCPTGARDVPQEIPMRVVGISGYMHKGDGI